MGITTLSLLAGCASGVPSTTSETTSLAESSSMTSSSTVPVITFRVNIPIDIAATSSIKIAGSFNGWDPLDAAYALTKIDTRDYEIELTFATSDVGMTIEYKYVLLLEGQSDNGWTNVEGSTTGGEIANRSYLVKAGTQTVLDTVQSFKNNIGLTSVTRGTLTKIMLAMPQYDDGRQRLIRVWLPDGYDPSDTDTRYPVLYMFDGQNLFDTYTAFAGEWRIDESMGTLMDDGYRGSIVVGIDNSSDRLNEYSPTWPRSSGGSPYITNPSGEKFSAFVFDTVKPYVDGHFNTNPDRETTGIGGSSMGGVMALYMALTYPDVFGYALLFSTALWVYENGMTETFINGINLESAAAWPRLYVYAGGLEPSVTPYVALIKNALIDHGYSSGDINDHVDPAKSHNEAAWSVYFPIGYRWLIGI